MTRDDDPTGTDSDAGSDGRPRAGDGRPGGDAAADGPGSGTAAPEAGTDPADGGPTAGGTGGDPTDGDAEEGLTAGDVAVGSLVAVAGLALLAQPVLGRVGTPTLWVRPVVLSGAALSAALGLGAVLDRRRGRTARALGGAGVAAGWAVVTVGALAGAGTVLSAGLLVVCGAACALAARRRWERRLRRR